MTLVSVIGVIFMVSTIVAIKGSLWVRRNGHHVMPMYGIAPYKHERIYLTITTVAIVMSFLSGVDLVGMALYKDHTQKASCYDGQKNGRETDVDCGGPKCDPCNEFKACLVDDDCLSNVCRDSLCQALTCADGMRSGDETDVDCGGSCSACALGKHCRNNGDCQSTLCDHGVCIIPTNEEPSR